MCAPSIQKSAAFLSRIGPFEKPLISGSICARAQREARFSIIISTRAKRTPRETTIRMGMRQCQPFGVNETSRLGSGMGHQSGTVPRARGWITTDSGPALGWGRTPEAEGTGPEMQRCSMRPNGTCQSSSVVGDASWSGRTCTARPLCPLIKGTTLPSASFWIPGSLEPGF
jgi:hypothetical protein